LLAQIRRADGRVTRLTPNRRWVWAEVEGRQDRVKVPANDGLVVGMVLEHLALSADGDFWVFTGRLPRAGRAGMVVRSL
jgi:hypothetical protein